MSGTELGVAEVWKDHLYSIRTLESCSIHTSIAPAILKQAKP